MKRVLDFGDGRVDEVLLECWPGAGRVGAYVFSGSFGTGEPRREVMAFFRDQPRGEFDSVIFDLGDVRSPRFFDVCPAALFPVMHRLGARGGETVFVAPPESEPGRWLRNGSPLPVADDQAAAIAEIEKRARERPSRTLDFGALTIEETLVRTTDEGRRVGRVAIVGGYSGLEEGQSGPVWTYFGQTLPARFDLVLVNLERAKYVNDMALPQLEKLKNALRKRGGNAAVVVTTPKVRIVFTMLGIPFIADEATAFASLDSLSS